MLTSPATFWLILMGIIYGTLMIALPGLAAEKSVFNWDWQG
jgi:TctA family transporter